MEIKFPNGEVTHIDMNPHHGKNGQFASGGGGGGGSASAPASGGSGGSSGEIDQKAYAQYKKGNAGKANEASTKMFASARNGAETSPEAMAGAISKTRSVHPALEKVEISHSGNTVTLKGVESSNATTMVNTLRKELKGWTSSSPSFGVVHLVKG